MILASLFRSYVQPFVVLTSIPLGFAGIVFGVGVFGYTVSFNLFYASVGLAGVVVNDALVMVDFINKRRREGASVVDAARDGAVQRLRPIISTTLTTCFGLAPLALGLGGKDEILAPMAISIAGGLGISTSLILLVVPAVYVIIVRDIAGRFRRHPPIVSAQTASWRREP